ncbi:hypothetical protein [Haloferula sargassicola]|uniref:Uncharacterized protein n=1 Tax=Haloferula sargassicola TaxID=490096 RepID=A0ABP9UNG7_9BACT
MKIPRLFLATSLLSLIPIAGARTVEIDGKLLNLTDASGDFPTGAAFHVSFELDDSVPDGLNAEYEGRYADCVSSVTFSVPSTSYTLNATAGTHTLFIRTDQPLNEPSVEVALDLTAAGSSETYVLELEWLQKPGMPPATDDLTQDLGTGSFRLISAKFGVKRTVPGGGPTYTDILGFGWARAEGVAPGPTPPPVRRGGYAHPVVFGDSLSATENPGADPDKYFNGGVTNGPVWVEYLSWLLHMDYDPKLNFSAFGGIVMPSYPEIADYAYDRSLGIYWSQSAVFSAVVVILFAGEDEGFFNALGVAAQEEIVRMAELAYTLGLRDYLMLSTADVTIAPFVKQLLPPASLAALQQLVLDLEPDLDAYRQNWFGGLFPGMRTSLVDPNDYLSELSANPAGFGFTDLDSYHLDTGPTPYRDYFGNPGSTYLFWDEIAPTTKVHAHLAGRVFDDVFAGGSPQRFRSQLVGLDGSQAWVFAAEPPTGVPIQVKQDSGLGFGPAPVRTFSTQDPCLFLILDRPSATQGFYRLESP